MLIVISTLLMICQESDGLGGVFADSNLKGEYELVFEEKQTYTSEHFEDIVMTMVVKDTLYVLDRGAFKIHMLDLETGAYKGSMGRKGEGPGEFTFIHWPKMIRVGNQIGVIDREVVNYFDFEGAFVSFKRLPAKIVGIRRIQPLDDTRFLLSVRNFKDGPNYRYNEDRVIIWDETTESEKVLMTIEAGVYQTVDKCWKQRVYGDFSLFFLVDDDKHIAYARTHESKIHLADLSGNHVRSIPIPWTSYPISDASKAEYVDYMQGTYKSSGCLKYDTDDAPVFMALLPLGEHFLVGEYRRYDGLFDVRVLSREGKILGSGRYSFGESGRLSPGEDSDKFVYGIDPELDEWLIKRITLRLVPRSEKL